MLRVHVEIGICEGWLDQDDAHIELSNFMIQGFGESPESMLAARINAHKWRRAKA